MRPKALVLVATLLLSPLAHAHVTVWPRESSSGGFEKYVVRVPTEGRVATASVELRLPEGVTLVAVGVPQGFRCEVKRVADRAVALVWSQRIEPGEFAEFSFMARNPPVEGALAWNAVQTFVDGSQTAWTGPAGDPHPASVTALKAPAAAGSTHQH